MTEREALKLALEALDIVKRHYTQNRHVNEAITAIKEALAQPEHEPDDLTIAYMSGVYDGKKQRTWVGLTDEEAAATAYKGFDEYWTEDCKGSEIEAWAAAGRAIEAKLKEKNSGNT